MRGMNGTEKRQLAKALAKALSPAEAAAVYAALGQFVENAECCDAYEDAEQESEHLLAARAVMERMDASLAALAR